MTSGDFLSLQVVKPFLEPKTQNKVKFVYSDDLNTVKIMEDLFVMDQLESAFGGKDSSGFNINKYAERMREDDKRMPSFWATETPPSVAPQPALTSGAPLDSLNLKSDSDTSDNEKNDPSLQHGIESKVESSDDNVLTTESKVESSDENGLTPKSKVQPSDDNVLTTDCSKNVVGEVH